MIVLNKIIWGFTSIIIISFGIYLTFKTKGIQFELINFKNKKTNEKEVSPLSSLMMSIAAKVGVGSLAGTALAISIGGEGTIFWMWITSIISAPLAYLEGYLGYKYKNKKAIVGGPSYYIKEVLNNKVLSIIYSIIIIIVYTVCFTTIQANTISISINKFTGINRLIIGLVLIIIIYILIRQDNIKLFRINSKIVPIIGIIYVITGGIVIIRNYTQIPHILYNILKKAFYNKNKKIIISSIIIGIQRGIFSSEAGIGTSAISSAEASNSSSHNQGILQVIGVYFISFVITTLTSFIILLSKSNILKNSPNGIEITQNAFSYHFGIFGELLLVILILLFALSTITAGYFYSKKSLKFLMNNKYKKTNKLLLILTIMLCMIGSIIDPENIWNIADFFIAVLAIINIYSMFKLRNKYLKE